jgi:hypothetical protein
MTRDEKAALVREWSERLVSADEVRAALERPIDPAEREDLMSLVRWFTRRYPTGADRLAYVRQAYERWTRLGAGR